MLVAPEDLLEPLAVEMCCLGSISCWTQNWCSLNTPPTVKAPHSVWSLTCMKDRTHPSCFQSGIKYQKQLIFSLLQHQRGVRTVLFLSLAFCCASQWSVCELCLTPLDKLAAWPVTPGNVTHFKMHKNANLRNPLLPCNFSQDICSNFTMHVWWGSSSNIVKYQIKTSFGAHEKAATAGKVSSARAAVVSWCNSFSHHDSHFPHSGFLFPHVIRPSPRSNMLSASRQSPYWALCCFEEVETYFTPYLHWKRLQSCQIPCSSQLPGQRGPLNCLLK